MVWACCGPAIDHWCRRGSAQRRAEPGPGPAQLLGRCHREKSPSTGKVAHGDLPASIRRSCSSFSILLQRRGGAGQPSAQNSTSADSRRLPHMPSRGRLGQSAGSITAARGGSPDGRSRGRGRLLPNRVFTTFGWCTFSAAIRYTGGARQGWCGGARRPPPSHRFTAGSRKADLPGR